MNDAMPILDWRPWLGEAIQLIILFLVAFLLWLSAAFQKDYLDDALTASVVLYGLYVLIARFGIAGSHHKAIRLTKRNRFLEV